MEGNSSHLRATKGKVEAVATALPRVGNTPALQGTCCRHDMSTGRRQGSGVHQSPEVSPVKPPHPAPSAGLPTSAETFMTQVSGEVTLLLRKGSVRPGYREGEPCPQQWPVCALGTKSPSARTLPQDSSRLGISPQATHIARLG